MGHALSKGSQCDVLTWGLPQKPNHRCRSTHTQTAIAGSDTAQLALAFLAAAPITAASLQDTGSQVAKWQQCCNT